MSVWSHSRPTVAVSVVCALLAVPAATRADDAVVIGREKAADAVFVSVYINKAPGREQVRNQMEQSLLRSLYESDPKLPAEEATRKVLAFRSAQEHVWDRDPRFEDMSYWVDVAAEGLKAASDHLDP